jgi:outer membrane lipoprotein SlyB
MKNKINLLVIVAVIIFTGCASITRGSKEVVVIDSSPQDADVRLSTGMTGRTPASFEVGRRDTVTVTISKPGYISRTVVLNSEVGGGGGAAMAGNVLVGGIIGAGIDAGTGAMYEHKPNPLMVILEKTQLESKSVSATEPTR